MSARAGAGVRLAARREGAAAMKMTDMAAARKCIRQTAPPMTFIEMKKTIWPLA